MKQKTTCVSGHGRDELSGIELELRPGEAMRRAPGKSEARHRDRASLARAAALALLLAFMSGGLLLAGEAGSKPVTLEWMFKKKELGLRDPMKGLPGGFQWSHEGHLLAYTAKTDRHGEILVVLDPDSPKRPVVLTPSQAREALASLGEDGGAVVPGGRLTLEEATAPDSGATEPAEDAASGTEEEKAPELSSMTWLERSRRLAFELDGKRLVFDPLAYDLSADSRPAVPGEENENIDRSPSGRYAAYTRGNDLYVFDFRDGRESRLTSGGSETILNGKFPWVYWEEIMWRLTYQAYAWRPQGDAIAYLQFDEEGVSTYPITDFSTVVPTTKMQRYPKVGTRNPTVRLGIVSISSRETRWVDLGEEHEYITDVRWKPDGSALTVQTMNRRQDRLGLYEVDASTARGRLILEESTKTWIEPVDTPRFLSSGEAFVWPSERTGFRHLYVIARDGGRARALTSGDWEVEQPGFQGRSIFLDEAGGQVFFLSTERSPLERHIYAVPVDGGPRRRLTREPGTHSMHFSRDGAFTIDTWSSFDVPKRIDLLDRDGNAVARIGGVSREEYAPYRFGTPRLVEIEDGAGRRFHASLLEPFDFDPKRKYPVVAFVYGEVAGQVVENRWIAGFDMVLAEHGFLVFRFDARGTPGRGRAWLDPVYGNQCDAPMEDWKAAVAYLKNLPYVDGARMGVWGHSGGGTMTLNLMLRTPGLFRAGAALSAVSDKRLYDTIYTERYLGLLSENEKGYESSSPLFAAGNLEGSLLVAHGISDDNVHVQNAYNLVEALNAAGKDYRLYLYPQKRHGISGDDVQYHLRARMLQFFEETLRPGD